MLINKSINENACVFVIEMTDIFHYKLKLLVDKYQIKPNNYFTYSLFVGGRNEKNHEK